MRHGCILSPLLFNLSQYTFEAAISDLEVRFKINETYINNIRYADSTTFISDSLDVLQLLISIKSIPYAKAKILVNEKRQ